MEKASDLAAPDTYDTMGWWMTVLCSGTRVPNDDPDSVALAVGGELVLAPPVTGG